MGQKQQVRGRTTTFKPTIRERAIEKYFISQIGKLGGLTYKLTAGYGWPDRLVCLPSGYLDLVELKRPRGAMVSKLQVSVHKKLRQRNMIVKILYSKEQVDDYIKFLTDKILL